VRTLNFFDPDTPPCPNIDRYARLAAGAALRAAKARAFSLMRPPGHHAGRERVAGFCYFNNLAVAVKSTGLKTLILDVDGHHGDGTQAIFLGDDQVILISLHRSPWYPGTGLRSEQNCFNYPLRAFCGDEIYLKTLERALDRVAMHGIEQVAVSAGFDTFLTDDLASLGLSTECYREIGRRIARLGLPTFAVLEGGYDVQHLGENIQAFLQGFNSSGSPAGASGP
jgi:acetoin utilization deacetylase AcuC-like enzyme